jgi:hypothetical protein
MTQVLLQERQEIMLREEPMQKIDQVCMMNTIYSVDFYLHPLFQSSEVVVDRQN